MIYPMRVGGARPRVIIIRQPIKIERGRARVQHQFQLITCIFMSMVQCVFADGYAGRARTEKSADTCHGLDLGA